MNAWVEQLNALAAAWGDHLWRGIWQGGLALLMVWAICRLMPKLSPAVRYALWCGAFLKLLLAAMPIGTVDLALLRAPPAVVTNNAFVAPLAQASLQTFERNNNAMVRERPTAVPAIRPTSQAILLGAWATGVIIMLIRLARDRVAATLLRRSASAIDDPALLAELDQLCKRFGVRRPVRLLATDGIDSPLLLGVWQPAIVLPWRVAGRGRMGQVRLMIAHELAHLRHRDLVLNLLPAAARVLFYFHPLVWLAEREWRLTQESACDRAAVALTDCGVGDYGDMLLDVAAMAREGVGGGTRRLGGAAIAVLDSRNTLERRLRAMRYFSNWSRRSNSRVMAIALALIVLVALVPWRVVAQQPAPTSSQQTTKGGQEHPATATAANATSRETEKPPAAGGQTMEVVGTLTAASAPVKCPTDTVVREVSVKEGARVKKGDLLFQLDYRRARDAIAEAELQLRSAELKYQRLKSMQASAAVSRAELDEAQGALELARNTLQSRQHDLQDTRIIAPFDAIIERLDVHSGQGVSKNQVLCVLLEAGTPTLEMAVPERFYPRLHAGNPVEGATEILPGRKFAGEVSFVAPRIDAATGTILVKATVADPKDELKPGMHMRAKLTLAD